MANRYFIMGQAYLSVEAGDTALITEAPLRIATGGAITYHCTQIGTFHIFLANGTTATVTSDQATIDAISLVVGSNTVTCSSIAGGEHFTINITIGTAANWNTTASWSASSGGKCTASVPTSADATLFDANSFTAASQNITFGIVGEDANCASMDWTGITNNPSFTCNAFAGSLICAGNVTLSANLTSFIVAGVGDTCTMRGTWITNGITIQAASSLNIAGTFNQGSDLTTSVSIYITYASVVYNTNNFALTILGLSSWSNPTYNLGSSIVTVGSWSVPSGATLNAGTSSIRVSGTGAFSGGGKTYYEVQLNGTAHTVSGNNTFTNFIRNGTATKTDTLTLTAGSTQTVTGVCSLIGNSAINRLLVQSSTLGTAATLHVDGAWTSTNAVDFMDITSTHAVDLSSLVTYDKFTGDCGGNTGFTFSVTDTETYGDATGSWSDVTKWTGAVTTRVPLPQDTVACAVTTAGRTITIDMPRIGGNVSFAGAANSPTLTKGINFSIYGSLNLTGIGTYTANTYVEYFRGRTAGLTLTSATKTIYSPTLYAPSGTYTLQDALAISYAYVQANGTLNDGGQTITLSNATAITKWDVTGGTITATGTIVLTNAGVTAQTFAGYGQTYNNVTVQGAGAYTLTMTGNNIFNGTFTVDRSVANKALVSTGYTQTFANFVCATSGTRTLAITGGQFTKTGVGKVIIAYCNVTNNVGTPAVTWYATPNGTLTGTCTGWGLTLPASMVKFLSQLMASTFYFEPITTALFDRYGRPVKIRAN